MKLVTENGQLDLPEDFSMTMERTNPLLSDEGDATVPATLPSSSRNLAALGHRERIDRANRYTNKMDAVLEVGPVQKRGQLVIDTLNRRDGIDASFAIDSSDLYVKAKSKSLKEIVKEVGKTEAFGSVAAAVARMQNIYRNGDPADTYDYTVFPVAVSPFEEENNGVKTRHWQYNNEIDEYALLVSHARDVHEGELLMAVPEGYGVAPFIKLHKMLNIIFEAIGYTVTENCFNPDPTLEYPGNEPALVLLHNCADCLVTGTLYYEDMMPSCTFSQFLEWLLNKFHAQPVADSESRTVKIVLMEDILAGSADDDWTGKVEGDWDVVLQPKKRVVLNPKGQGDENEAEGEPTAISEEITDLETLTRPAARTLNGLVRKYGGYVVVNEDEWRNLPTDDAPYWDCLVLRRAEGMFYRMDRKMEPEEVTHYSGHPMEEPWTEMVSRQVPKAIGTNLMSYDRYNSDETELFNQDDTVPLMTIDEKSKRVAPYIGKRLHYHTTYAGGENEETDQPIMLAWRVRTESVLLSPYYNSGTTQDLVPLSEPLDLGPSGIYYGLETPFALTNEAMYAAYWTRYNELLLNQSPHMKARVAISLGRFLGMDMSRPKLVDGQALLPLTASSNLGARQGLTDVETMPVKKWADGAGDTAILPSDTYNGLVWGVENDAEAVGERAFNAIMAAHPTLIAPTGGEYILYANDFAYIETQVEYAGDSVYLGHPLRAGETRIVGRKYDIGVVVKTYINSQVFDGYAYYLLKNDGMHFLYAENSPLVDLGSYSGNLSEWLSQVRITSTFTAVAV